ncbi:unnamed protein product [Caenorhabditis angaria]|uniref:KNTC1 first ARM-repeats domain-containing protein n=1 Tax=Caenorhabditis angaria TaxID=860376 RepID=A0A9P1MYC7_9PELO|nr:unnamed protein product [Caenorhabditis angaria]
MVVRLANFIETNDEIEEETMATRGLFDLSTLLKILPDESENAPKNDKSWAIKTAQSQRYLILASGLQMVVFNLEESAAKAEKQYTMNFDAPINDIEIIGDSCFICIVYGDHNISILSMENKTLYFNEKSPTPIAHVNCNISNDQCNLVFANNSGQTFKAVFDSGVAEGHGVNRIVNLSNDEILKYFKKHLVYEITPQDLDFSNINGPISFISTGSLQSFASLNETSGFHWNDVDSKEFIEFESDEKWLKIRETGRFTLFLAENGCIHVFDPTTLSFVDVLDLKPEETDKILDFVIVENDVYGVPMVYAMVIQKANQNEYYLVIFDKSKESVTFEVKCSMDTSIFAFEGSDRILITVEEVDQSVVVNQVSQSRPELKFEALLKQNRFDEAETFAKTHNLDLQKVYRGRAYYLIDRCDENEEDFKIMLKTVDMITDNDMVADLFFSLIQMSQKFDRINTYLSRAKKRRITDLETLKHIENCCFILSTYQIIRGPNFKGNEDGEKMERESIWEVFVNALHGEDEWVKLYLKFVQMAAITDARVIWSRHGKSIIDFVLQEIEQNSISKLFDLFSEAISIDITCWNSLIEHISIDIFQECLDFSDSLVPFVEQLVVHVITCLEIRDSANWPDNAIKASNCFENMTKVLAERFITPQDQAYLAINARVLCVSDDERNKTTPISRMMRVHHILLDIKKLATDYCCQIQFSLYPNLTNEDICHRILQNALYDPNTTNAKIEKFVKPFMQERNLNQDQTIFNYIQIMSGNAFSINKNGGNNVSNSAMNIIGWEIQCVQLCASLADETRKCRSIISIASAAKIPWPRPLNEAVERILKSRSLARSDIDEMRSVCQQTELIQLLSSYYPQDRSFYNFISPKNKNIMFDIIPIIRCIIADEERNSRFVDAIKVLELVDLVTQIDWRESLNLEYVKAEIVIHMMKSGDVTKSIINYICQLDETEKESTINLVVEFIKTSAESPILESRQKILDIGEQIVSYFMTKKTENLCDLRKKLILIRDLYEERKMTTLLSDFNEKSWQEAQIRYYRKNEQLTIYEKIKKCTKIGIAIDELMTAMLSDACAGNNYQQMVDIFVASVESVGTWITPSQEIVDVICELLVFIVYRIPNIYENETDADQAQNLIEMIGSMSRSLRKLLSTFSLEILENDIDYLLQIESYFYMFERIVKQALKGQDLETETNSNSQNQHQDEIARESRLIYGFSRRHGIYDCSNDPALFEGVSAILAAARVAPSVARPYTSDISENEAHDFRMNWEELTMFLAMHSQVLLDVNVRVYACSLKCFSGEWRQAILEIGQSVFTVVERMIQQEKFDGWHAATLLNGLTGTEANKKMLELRGSTGIQRNIQAQINFITLAFFMTFRSQSFEMLPSIIHSAENKFLVKKLAKLGIRTNLAGQSPDIVEKIVRQAANLATPLAPFRLFEYLEIILEKFVRGAGKNGAKSIEEFMIQYAFLIVQKASAAGNCGDSKMRSKKIEELLEIAGSALYMLDTEKCGELVCNYFQCLVYVICPYNYEVIQFCCHILSRFSTEDEMAKGGFCKNLQNVVSFLWGYQRTNHMTKEESIWYTKREHRLAADLKEYEKTSGHMYPFGMALKMDYEGSNDDMSDSTEADSTCSNKDIVYEKDNVIISDIPPLSSKRIPLHIFLMQKKNDIDEVLMEIVKSELSITNVTIWQSSLRSVNWLSKRFSRTQLLSSAIFSHANRFAKVEQSLPKEDRYVISYLLSSNPNRSVVISTIALLFRKIILSDVKIDLLRMGLEIAQKWINTPEIEPAMDENERLAIVEQCDRLKDGIAKFYTELALKKNGMFNEKTADSVEKVEELCTIIYDEVIDWSDSKDVELKCEIVEQIAAANSLDLPKLHENILMNWINDQVVVQSFDHIDLNDSLGGGSFLTNTSDDPNINNKSSQNSNDEILKLPIFDKVVDKMTHLCQKIDRHDLLSKLFSIFVQSGEKTANGFVSIVRASSILLRNFSDAEMKAWNGKVSHVWLCEKTGEHLINRLMHLTNVKPSTSGQNQDNSQLIRSLLQCPTRTPIMSTLIACLIIDNSYKETKNIEQIIARLQISKQWTILKALLDYSIDNELSCDIKSFALAWFRVYENALTEDVRSTDSEWSDWQCVSLRKWSLWSMKCNVEGGRQTNIYRILRDLSCPISAYIITLISNFNSMKLEPIDTKNLKRDLELGWTKEQTNRNVSNSIVVKMEE